MKQRFWNTFYYTILKNRWLILSIIFVMVLSFGFTITNFSIGVDDPARLHYLYSSDRGNMIQQGRLLHVLVNKLTDTIAFIPFFNDFLGASLFALSAILFCTLFQTVSNQKLSTQILISFAAVYISYSIINEKFIYNLDVVVTMLSYCTCALSLIYSYAYVVDCNKRDLFGAIGLLILSISSYESFIFLYFCGVFAIYLIKIIVNDENIRFKDLICKGLRYAVILVAAVAIYYFIVVVVQLLTHQFGLFKRTSEWRWFKDLSPLRQVIAVSKTIFKPFLVSSYLPLKEFTIISVIGFALMAYLSVKRKNPVIMLCYFAFWAGNFGIHYVVGFTMYRAAQTFCLFIGFTVLLLVYMVQHHIKLRKIIICAVAFLTIIQSADMNRWFYNDYIRYRKETFVVDSIATKLIGEFDVQKPVVFTSSEKADYLYNYNTYPDGQVNGASVIDWGLKAFNDPTTPLLIDLFYMHGYDFIKRPSLDQALHGIQLSKDMPGWPSPECIKEFDTFIVVNIGETIKTAE